MRITRCRRLALAIATCAVVLACAPASSQAATKAECAVHSLPSFVAQGLNANAASVGDVVDVACFEEAG